MTGVSTSQSADQIFRARIRFDVEEFWAMALSSNLKLIRLEMIFRGGVDYCPAHPREILRFVCLQNASSYVIAHSHPSGDPTPSRKDLQVTRQLQKLSQLLGVELLDHLILSEKSYCSLADRGFFRKRDSTILNPFLLEKLEKLETPKFSER